MPRRIKPKNWIPSEALFAFMGWVTSRTEITPELGSSRNASPAVKLISEFMKKHNLAEPREGWHLYDK
jgi:hypothetical protein